MTENTGKRASGRSEVEKTHDLSGRKQEKISKIRLQETVIVEGRYDRIKLSECIASPIVETGGFRIFKDKEKQELIRAIARKRGILVMTDVDSAGFVIRNFLRGIVPQESILHAYIPTVKGKERRKPEASKEGILGVEGIDRDALIASVQNSGAHILGDGEGVISPDNQNMSAEHYEITKLDFFNYGLTGSENSAKYREEILADLGLPQYLTANAMLSAVNCLFTKEEFEDYFVQLNQDK